GESAMLKANIKIWPHKVVDSGSTLATSLVWGEKWNKYLFGATGISGLGNIEITPEFASKIGAACGAFFGKQANVATSRDSHKTSRLINRALISGILSCGCNVHDLQVMPPPVARYQLPANNHKCCIHTRKSPLDPKMIEIKFYDSNGMALSVSKQKAIERFFFREDFARAGCEETGTIHFPHRTVDIYCEGLLKFINVESIRQTPFKIVIDYAYGAASIILPQLLGQLGVEAVSLNAFIDEKRLTQDPQMFSTSLRQLSNIVQSLGADFGVMFDASTEKIHLVDETGRILTDDMLLSIMCYLVMKTAAEKTVITVPVTASKIIEEMASKFDCKVIRTKTTLRNMMETALAEKATLAGDGVGTYGFPMFQPASDGMVTLCKLLEMLAVVKKPLSDIVKEIPASRLIKVQLPCPWECKGTVMRNLIEYTKNLNIDLIDGVKVYYDNKDWILIIPDPDRPFFHLYVETATEEASNRLIKQYSDNIRNWQTAAEPEEK
ncbi:MAG TPA: nucleotidyltransferase, partial [Candidatus Wallbacteria bacterium]|nr:nucleotidyltransferase [Candidatus Wallbacteria bacterium]